MKNYNYKNEKELKEQVGLFIEEVATGIFRIVKNRYGAVGYLIAPEDVIELFNNKENKVALKSKDRIQLNY